MNKTCEDRTDKVMIPFNQCVGPFGDPRPWGTFLLIEEDENVESKTV
eukprot:CAMPEP_0172502152 /NCGR_PEP_ID=MMETSP1066-20121228/157160_1 /TAXON_ID=671091 /ORGANISM="Coscinodiscus wailesii, Strain CCMP2513" /LENGTH=46 /DNA_ID= /DNA_START= /DNA_END= /DNA_ORIENTATION=